MSEKKKHLPATNVGTVSLADLVGAFDDESLEHQAKADAEFGSSGGGKKWFRLGPDNLIRMCPPRKGSKLLYKEAYRHGVADAGEGKYRPYICVAKMRPAGRCYICEVLAAAERECDPKDKETLREIQGQSPRWGAYWNVVDMKQPEAGAQIAWLPTTVHKEIKVQTGIEDREIDKRPWDLEEGFPIKITRDDRNKYTIRFLEKKGGPIEPESYLGMGDLEAEAAPPTPNELFRVAKHMAETYDVLGQMDWDDVEFNKKSSAPAKKAKKKVDDDDDDDYEAVATVSDDDDEDEKPKRKVTIEMPKKKAKKKVEDDEDDWS